MDQAAAVASYAEVPEVAAGLIAPAADGDGALAHAVTRAKHDRAERRRIAAAVKDLTEAGVTVIEEPDRDSPARDIDRLKQDDEIQSVYVCTDPEGNGHVDRWAGTGGTGSLTNANGTSGGSMTDEQKAERKALIAANKAMRAATETRRAWVRDFLARRSTPKGSLRYAADVLTGTEQRYRRLLTPWFKGMPNQPENEARDQLASVQTRSAMRGWGWPCSPRSPVRSSPRSTAPPPTTKPQTPRTTGRATPGPSRSNETTRGRFL